MAATRTALKQYFKKYATPTEEQFAALIDAFVHKDEDSLTQSKIDGLTAALESKVSSSDLASAVATAVAETLQGGDIEVTPAAHEHAVSDISGLGARLTTLETSKADYEAFKTLVTAFLNDADVSDTTINRWKELEDFLSGITDSDTLAGMLQALKAEILAEVPQPQTGNYLKQISDLDAYTEAQEGEIVQYVGSTTENYRRGFCYERVAGDVQTLFGIQINGDMPKPINDRVFIRSSDTLRTYKSSNLFIIPQGDEPSVGDVAVYMPISGEVMTTSVSSITSNNGNPFYSFANGMSALSFSETQVPIYCNNEGVKIAHNTGYNEMALPIQVTSAGSLNFILLADASEEIEAFNAESATVDMFESTTPSTWQPIATSPVVS